MEKKLQLLIVDDEKHVRNFLKLFIDWHSLGIEICGEASCAEEGLLLVDELQPNIIISDVCMDYMDGIDFSRTVKSRYACIKIILLTGHSEFEYAKRGIDAGVSAYLLKPIDEKQILETLLSLKKEILTENIKEEELNSMRSYLEENKPLLISNYLNALMMPDCDYNFVIHQLSYLNTDLQPSFFQVIVFALNPAAEKDNSPSDLFLYSLRCHQILQEMTESIDHLYLLYDLNHKNILLSNNPAFNLQIFLENLKVTLTERLSCHFTIGVGQSCGSVKNLRNSYLSAINAAKYRTVFGNNQIIQHNCLGISFNEQFYSLEDMISSLITAVHTCDYTESEHLIDSCINRQLSQNSTDIIPVRVVISTIVNHMMNLLAQNNLQNTDAFSECILAHSKLFRLDTVKELKSMTLHLIRQIIDTFQELRADQSNDLICSVVKYLENHFYDNELSLSSVAEIFFVNSSYLSRLFSQKNGVPFSKFLIELRLKEAAKMVVTSNLKSYEIAEKAGFNDPKYFSTSFKKYYGMTIGEYRLANSSPQHSFYN